MAKKNPYYKIVHINQRTGEFESAVMGELRRGNPLRLAYQVGKWTEPKVPDSRIFIFSKRQDANSFLTDQIGGKRRGFKLFECQAKDPRKLKVKELTSPSHSCRTIRRFWKAEKKSQESLFPGLGTNPVRGTLVASAVRIVRELDT